ncbi:MAG: XRE family transcriptional regulator [Flavobacterium sp.]|nr:MAG: XRE family transcriptional regulator [Flavobacterium sp.]
MHGDKIKTIRELRGFSQEYMASELGIAQNSYSKIETNQIKLTADTLQKISEILCVSIQDIMSHYPVLVNFDFVNDKRNKGMQEKLPSLDKDLVEKLIAAKDNEIHYLRELVNGLLKEIKMG